MLEPRTIHLKGAEQGAQRAAAVGLELKRCPAVRAHRVRVEKGVNLLLEEVALEERVFCPAPRKGIFQAHSPDASRTGSGPNSRTISRRLIASGPFRNS